MEPVLAEDGFFYEKEAIEKWFENSDVSPMTRKVIKKDLIKSFVLKYEDEIGRSILFDDDENQKK